MIACTYRRPRFDRRREARERVNDGEHSQFPSGRKLVMDEVHCPGLVRLRGDCRSSRSFALTRRFDVLIGNCKPNLAVQPV
jgi:hypothetical protein